MSNNSNDPVGLLDIEDSYTIISCEFVNPCWMCHVFFGNITPRAQLTLQSRKDWDATRKILRERFPTAKIEKQG